MTRVTLRIDHIVSDWPNLDRTALEAAFRQEIEQWVASEGTAALGQGGYRELVQAEMASSRSALAPRVAAAAVRAVKP